MATNFADKVKASSHMKKKDILVNNFLGGLAWGLGTVVGAGVIVAVLGWILNLVGLFDPIKSFFGQTPPSFYR